MVTTAFVHIWGERVGAVAWNEQTQVASFEFFPSYISKNIDLAPLTMPISNGANIYTFSDLRAYNEEQNTFKGLPGLLADVLPDKYGNQLINMFLSQNGRPPNSMNPVEQLCFIGTRGMGALEFEPSELKITKRAFNIELDGLVEAAQKMLGNRVNFETNLAHDENQAMMDILKIGTSAGGARPKAIIAYNKSTGQVKSGQTLAPKGFDHWLLKLDGVNDAQFGESLGYGRVEMAYYLMAKAAKIDMMPCELLEENGRAHFMTKRFDRVGNSEKFHVQTFCAMRHFDFNQVGSFSYEQLFQTMRMLGLSYPDAEQMYRRMVFNVLAKNCDDHTKNFAFRLKQGGNWELAPAYDVCYAYRADSQWVSQHALSINGKRKDFTKNDLLIIAKAMSIKKANKIITEIGLVVQQWPTFAKETGVKNRLMKVISSNLVVLGD
jgi:serine/threonine-protein kinase HipA